VREGCTLQRWVRIVRVLLTAVCIRLLAVRWVRTLDTNMDVVLLVLLRDLFPALIGFRKGIESFEVLDGHTRACLSRAEGEG
jgi:hypothetical protein